VTAVAALAYICVMLDHTPAGTTAKIDKVNDVALIFLKVSLAPLRVYHSSENIPLSREPFAPYVLYPFTSV